MQEPVRHTDRLGNEVKVGDEIRVLQVDVEPGVDDDEREMFEYMVGATCEIERFDDAGRAWVTMWWWLNGEGTATTSIGLASHQMEKATPVVVGA
jgi:hypothetical protein